MNNYPNLIIDMHTHLFNARYVPLNEIMLRRGVPPGASHLLSRLILALTGRSSLRKSGSFELATESDDKAELLMERIAEVTAVQYTGDLGESLAASMEFSNDDREVIYDTKDAVEDTELHRVLVDINQVFGDEESTQELQLDKLTGLNLNVFSKEMAFESVELKALFGRGLKRMVRRLLRKALRFVENATDTLDFFYTMMRSEKSLLKRLSKYYKRHTTNYLLVHHMMDMEYPFNGKVKYPFYQKQLSRMTSLERYSEGNAVGFAAFDPIRFVQGGDDNTVILQHMDIALNEGKIGFKFYPPMGYRAANNEDDPRLEAVIDVFFDYCAEHAVPVFTHCTPVGFEAVVGKSGSNAHPKYWELALTKSVERNNLILCFGHAGGGERKSGNEVIRGWLSSTDAEWDHNDNYARWVVDLCRRFPNVYCEISYIHEIIHDSAEKKRLKNRLILEYGRDSSDSHPHFIKDKIMYGSDWHMPSMVNDIDKYLADIVDIFSVDSLKDHKESFFAGNALSYLNLNEFSTRARHQLSVKCADELVRKYNLIQ